MFLPRVYHGLSYAVSFSRLASAHRPVRQQSLLCRCGEGGGAIRTSIASEQCCNSQRPRFSFGTTDKCRAGDAPSIADRWHDAGVVADWKVADVTFSEKLPSDAPPEADFDCRLPATLHRLRRRLLEGGGIVVKSQSVAGWLHEPGEEFRKQRRKPRRRHESAGIQ